jgi:hypothetical protein
MSIQTINIGNVVNDGLGDDLRTAFQKVNANFSELNSSLTPIARNVGQTGLGIFKEKVGNEFQFKNLVSGTKITLDDFDNSIRINSSQPDAFVRIDTQAGIVSAANNNINISIQGGDNIITSASGSTITVDTIIDIEDVFTTFDFNGSGGTYPYVMQFSLANANVDFGTVTNPGTIDLDLGGI